MRTNDAALEFDRILERTGFAARWEKKNSLKIARKLIAKGSTPEYIAEITDLDLDTVRDLFEGT